MNDLLQDKTYIMVLIFQVWYPEFDALNNTKNRQWFVTHDDDCKRHNRYSVVLLKQKTNNKKQKKKNNNNKPKHINPLSTNRTKTCELTPFLDA